MKKNIILLFSTLIITVSILSKSNAQGTVIKKYFDNALLKSKDRLTKSDSYLTLQIMVMSSGNNQNKTLGKGVNNAQWYVAYGEATLPLPLNGHDENPLRSHISSGNVTYWFSDRVWNGQDITNIAGCKKPSIGNILNIPTITAPFSNSKTENGNISYYNTAMMGLGSSAALNLFTQWNWNVTKCVIMGDMLYGEINNGKYTFSISYGGVTPNDGGR